MVLLRRQLGDTLRSQRQRQSRTLREVSSAARVSLGYLSEVERGHKEASSELLAAICEALDVRLADVLREVSENLDRVETPAATSPAPAGMSPATGQSSAVSAARPAGARPRPVGRTALQEVIPPVEGEQAVRAAVPTTPRVVAAA